MKDTKSADFAVVVSALSTKWSDLPQEWFLAPVNTETNWTANMK